MSQSAAILDYLAQGHCLSPLDALSRFGTFRLAARVEELRRRGYPVETRIVTTSNGKRIAVYRLAKGQK